MKPRAKRRCGAGLLLFEAALTVLLIGVSLVFISRSLGSSLRALGQARRYESALLLAQTTLQRLEAEYELEEPPPMPQEGVEVVRGVQWQWRAATQPFGQAPHAVLNEAEALDQLTITVKELDAAAPVRVTLTSLVTAQGATP